MNPERLLQNFDRLIDTPDAVPRLRRFILDLAVRGKLVEQNPEDELAGELLKRIKKEKTQLIKNGIVRAPQLYDPLNENDLPFSLPKSWKWVRLSDVGSIIGGGTPPSKDESCFTEGGKGIAWLTPADLGKHNDLFISHGARDLTEKGLATSSAQLMPVGSVLFTSRAPIGYTAIAKNKISTNQGFKSVVPFISESNRYVAIYFTAFASWIDSKASGTTFKEVSGKIAANLPFPLPPLAEQHRLVAKVDELMKLCDELEATKSKRERRRDRLVAATLHGLNNSGSDPEANDRLPFEDSASFYFNHLPRLTTRPEHIQQLRQTILNLAVRGKLVPQSPKDETATKILARIKYAKKKFTRGGQVDESESSKRSDEQISVPLGWQTVPFREVLLSLQTGPFGSSLHQHDYETGGTPVINPASIQNERIVPIEKMAVGRKTLERLATFKLQKNDVVMGRRGEMGRCAVVTEKEAGWLCGTGSLVLRFTEDISPWFIVKMMSAPLIKVYLGGASVGATMQNLNQSILCEMPVGLPPLAEQNRIVAKVNELITLCDEMEMMITTTTTTSRKLLEATLQATLSNKKGGNHHAYL